MSKMSKGPWDYVEKDFSEGLIGRILGLGAHRTHQPDDELQKGVWPGAQASGRTKRNVAARQGRLGKLAGGDPFQRKRGADKIIEKDPFHPHSNRTTPRRNDDHDDRDDPFSRG